MQLQVRNMPHDDLAGVRLINLTPHPVTLIAEDGVEVVVPAESVPFRVQIDRQFIADLPIDGSMIPVFRTRVSAPGDLPVSTDGTLFIVSRLAADAFPERMDFVVPDQLVRGSDGVVIGARGLALR